MHKGPSVARYLGGVEKVDPSFFKIIQHPLINLTPHKISLHLSFYLVGGLFPPELEKAC